MTGFSAQWLSLREPADHRARNIKLLQEMLQYFARTQPGLGNSLQTPFRVMDLGCGTGSNLRALAESLPDYQHWTLVDYDPALLDAARTSLLNWADRAEPVEAPNDSIADAIDLPTSAAPAYITSQIQITRQSKHLTISFVQEDLAKNIGSMLSRKIDLVTAAAFFDLVSADWLVKFCHGLNAPLYTVLTYDGVEKWSPSHPADQSVLKAFHAHQATDKGFGMSAGPGAIEIMRAQLTSRGFDVRLEKSPWLLDTADQLLMQALASGSASAVAETKMVSASDLSAWLTARMHAESCEIGHWDLFATPH